MMNKIFKLMFYTTITLLIVMITGQFYMREGRRQVEQAYQAQIDDLTYKVNLLTMEINKFEIAMRVIKCESSGKHNSYGDAGESYGIAQFKRETFNLLKKKAGMPDLQWKNVNHQFILLIWAIENGELKRHWKRCYRKVMNNNDNLSN